MHFRVILIRLEEIPAETGIADRSDCGCSSIGNVCFLTDHIERIPETVSTSQDGWHAVKIGNRFGIDKIGNNQCQTSLLRRRRFFFVCKYLLTMKPSEAILNPIQIVKGVPGFIVTLYQKAG